MASLNQVVSEMAHALGQPNNYALRTNLRSLIIHTRNEVIRHSMEQHGYVDSVFQQKYKVSLIDVEDGELEGYGEVVKKGIPKIKRTEQKVPRPVRLTNNLPFARVSNDNYRFSQEIPYVKETSARFRQYLPGMKGCAAYDYINDYIYIYPAEGIPSVIENIKKIVIQAAFENPSQVNEQSTDAKSQLFSDDDEWFLSEDMIGQIKDIIIKRELLNNRRETDEIPNNVKVV